MFLAAGGVPPLLLVLLTMVGGCFAAASANVFNCVLDRDIDERMRRTRRRALPRHMVGTAGGDGLRRGPRGRRDAVLGYVRQLALGRPGARRERLLRLRLHAVAQAANLPEHRLGRDRRLLSAADRVDGGHRPLALAPFVLFAIVFFWTPPHTWALAFRYREDYAAAEVPMLPVVRSAPAVARRILIYCVLTVPVSLTLWPVAHTGWLYPSSRVWRDGVALSSPCSCSRRARAGLTDAALRPMRLFHWSNSYLALVFVAAAVDPLLR